MSRSATSHVRYCFFVLLLLTTPRAMGAVQDFSRKFSIALTSEADDFHLGLSSSERLSQTFVNYRPNTQSSNGIQVSAYGLTLAYRTTPASSAESNSRYGATSYEDIRGALNLGDKDQWLLVGYYNRYGGMYIENSYQIDPTYVQGSTYIKRNDISIFNSGFGVLYVFSPEKFSITAAVLQSAKQTESAGSWLALAGFDGTLFSAGDPLIPASVQSGFGKDATMNSGKFTTVSLSGGYGYTLTKWSFFLTVIGLIGPGYQWREYTVSGTDHTSTVNAQKTTLGAAAGFNGDNFFVGLSYVTNSTEFATESLRLQTNLTSTRWFIGCRF